MVQNYMSILGDYGADYRIKCRHCPMCGRILPEFVEYRSSQEPVI